MHIVPCTHVPSDEAKMQRCRSSESHMFRQMIPTCAGCSDGLLAHALQCCLPHEERSSMHANQVCSCNVQSILAETKNNTMTLSGASMSRHEQIRQSNHNQSISASSTATWPLLLMSCVIASAFGVASLTWWSWRRLSGFETETPALKTCINH